MDMSTASRLEEAAAWAREQLGGLADSVRQELGEVARGLETDTPPCGLEIMLTALEAAECHVGRQLQGIRVARDRQDGASANPVGKED